MQVPSTDGVQVTVHDLGGEGPPLLLAHATGFHGLVWNGLADRLAERFHVWSIDARGHGASSTGDLAWPRMATDLHAVIDALDLDRPFVLGHSLGGALAVIAEADRPGTFRAIYLYEPAIMPPDNPGAPELLMAEGALRRRAVFESRQAAYDHYRSKPPLNELSEAALWGYVRHGFVDGPDGTVTLACTPEHEAETFRCAGGGDAYRAMSEITCPVTLAVGGMTSTGPLPQIDEQARLLRARRVTVAGLGHFGPLHDHDAVARSVVEALLGG